MARPKLTEEQVKMNETAAAKTLADTISQFQAGTFDLANDALEGKTFLHSVLKATSLETVKAFVAVVDAAVVVAMTAMNRKELARLSAMGEVADSIDATTFLASKPKGRDAWSNPRVAQLPDNFYARRTKSGDAFLVSKVEAERAFTVAGDAVNYSSLGKLVASSPVFGETITTHSGYSFLYAHVVTEVVSEDGVVTMVSTIGDKLEFETAFEDLDWNFETIQKAMKFAMANDCSKMDTYGDAFSQRDKELVTRVWDTLQGK
jgi:hypothetical protein